MIRVPTSRLGGSGKANLNHSMHNGCFERSMLNYHLFYILSLERGNDLKNALYVSFFNSTKDARKDSSLKFK